MKIERFTPTEQTKKKKEEWMKQDDYQIQSYYYHDYFQKRQLQNIQGAFMVIHNAQYTSKNVFTNVPINISWFMLV